jgi:hypothetical protein
MRRPFLFCLFATLLLASGTCLSLASGVMSPGGPLPPWALLPIAAGTLVAGFGLEATLKRMTVPAPSGRKRWLELALVPALVASPALLHSFEHVLAFALFSLLGLRLVRSQPVTQNAAALAVGLDFAVEALLVYRGLYQYPDAGLAPLPLWLPALWGNLGVSALRLYGLLPAGRRAPGTG